MAVFYISERFFTENELTHFEKKHRYKISDIKYAAEAEIDFSSENEKNFLLEKGYPKIHARFFA